MAIEQNFLSAATVLQNFSTPQNFAKIEQAAQIMVASLQHSGKIISCGNGGSMCDAMHFAEELTGRYRKNRPAIAAVSISDPSHITCVGNDYGFDYIFSRYIESVGVKGDVFLGISTSGNSANVIKGLEAARAKGIHTIALTGKDGGVIGANALADIEIRVAHQGFADRVQEVHIKIIHTFIQLIEEALYPELCK